MYPSRMRTAHSLTASCSIHRGGVRARGMHAGGHAGGVGVCLRGPCVACSPPLWTEFLTHACENITFPQLLLRAVKIFKKLQRGQSVPSMFMSDLKISAAVFSAETSAMDVVGWMPSPLRSPAGKQKKKLFCNSSPCLIITF